MKSETRNLLAKETARIGVHKKTSENCMPRRFADKKQDSATIHEPIQWKEMVERNASCSDGGCGNE